MFWGLSFSSFQVCTCTHVHIYAHIPVQVCVHRHREDGSWCQESIPQLLSTWLTESNPESLIWLILLGSSLQRSSVSTFWIWKCRQLPRLPGIHMSSGDENPALWFGVNHWYFLLSSNSSSAASPSEGAPLAGSCSCTPHSFSKLQHPSHELLKENGFTHQLYHKYRRRCLSGKRHVLCLAVLTS